MAGPRYSIIPGDFADDGRADVGHFRVLNALGRHTDDAGWCRLKQLGIAEAVGLSRATVNRKLGDLEAWGYIERHAEDATGRAIWYRVLMDRHHRPAPPSPGDIQDEPDLFDERGVEAPSQAMQPTHGGRQEDGPVSGPLHVGYNQKVTPGVTASATPGVSPAVTAIERPLFNDQDSPLTPRAAGGDDATYGSGWQARQAETLRELEREGRHVPAVRHLLAPVLAARRVRGLKAGDLAALARDAGDLAVPLLEKASQVVLADRTTQTVTAAQIGAAVAAVRKGGLMIPIKPGTHAAQWAAWLRHYDATEPKMADLMRRQSGWQVPGPWPPGASGCGSDSPANDPSPSRTGGAS